MSPVLITGFLDIINLVVHFLGLGGGGTVSPVLTTGFLGNSNFLL